jgi:NifU-like protein involved in Fe-S cluster formation
MTTACRDDCCSVTPRLTVSELFERGLRRNRAAPLPVQGALCTDAEGQTAALSLDILEDRIAAISFRASTCATLIAYCELVAQTMTGLRIESALSLTAQSLADSLPGIPPLKRDRIVLAVAAYRAALMAANGQRVTSHE